MFDRSVEGGFAGHVKDTHNMWNYLYLMVYLSHKPDDEYTGQESYVSAKLQMQDMSFFPLNKSMDLQALAEGERATPDTAEEDAAPGPASEKNASSMTLPQIVIRRGTICHSEELAFAERDAGELHGVADEIHAKVKRLEYSVDVMGADVTARLDRVESALGDTAQKTDAHKADLQAMAGQVAALNTALVDMRDTAAHRMDTLEASVGRLEAMLAAALGPQGRPSASNGPLQAAAEATDAPVFGRTEPDDGDAVAARDRRGSGAGGRRGSGPSRKRSVTDPDTDESSDVRAAVSTGDSRGFGAGNRRNSGARHERAVMDHGTNGAVRSRSPGAAHEGPALDDHADTNGAVFEEDGAGARANGEDPDGAEAGAVARGQSDSPSRPHAPAMNGTIGNGSAAPELGIGAGLGVPPAKPRTLPKGAGVLPAAAAAKQPRAFVRTAAAVAANDTPTSLPTPPHPGRASSPSPVACPPVVPAVPRLALGKLQPAQPSPTVAESRCRLPQGAFATTPRSAASALTPRSDPSPTPTPRSSRSSPAPLFVAIDGSTTPRVLEGAAALSERARLPLLPGHGACTASLEDCARGERRDGGAAWCDAQH